MRWGFPDPRDWRRPRPIHARSETVDSKSPFRMPFHAGQRGVVVFRTFNHPDRSELGELGMHHSTVPKSFFKQVFYPFKAQFAAKT